MSPLLGQGVTLPVVAGSTVFCFFSRPLRLLGEAFFWVPPRLRFFRVALTLAMSVFLHFSCSASVSAFFEVLLLKFFIVEFSAWAFLSFVWGFPFAFPGGFTVEFISGECLR